jgi:hypothetical protein
MAGYQKAVMQQDDYANLRERLRRRLARLQLHELDRDRLIHFGKERAVEGAGPVTLSMTPANKPDQTASSWEPPALLSRKPMNYTLH